jgi:hypothetical protein
MSQTRLFGSSVLFFSANIDRGLSIFFFSKKPAFHLLVWVGVGSLSHLPLHSTLLFQFLELHCCLSEIFGGFWGGDEVLEFELRALLLLSRCSAT